MSQRVPDKDKVKNPPPPVYRRAPSTPAWLPAGLAVTVALAGWSVFEVRGARKDVAQVQVKLADLQGKVEAVAKAAPAPPPRRGPDPAKVHTVKTAGAPVKGAPNAPIVIAEFSDFQ